MGGQGGGPVLSEGPPKAGRRGALGKGRRSIQIHTQIQTLPLDLLASIAPVPAAMVTVPTNPIHSVIFPIPVFRNAAGLLVLLEIESIAMMFPIIYVGAIAVLLPSVATMPNIKINELGEN